MRLLTSTVVHGEPRGKGSKRHVGNGVLVEQGGANLKDWMAAVRQGLAVNMTQDRPHEGPVRLNLVCYRQRPKKHYRGKSGELRDDAPVWCDKSPDMDKVMRAINDAAERTVFRNDKQVCSHGRIDRLWGDSSLTLIEYHAL